MKKILFLILLGLPVLFLGGCSLINNNDNGINTGDLDQNNTKTTPAKSNNIAYYASRAGFGLKLPSERSGYVELSDQGGVDFSLNNRQMFYIHVQPINEYNQYGAPEAIPTPIYLGQNQNYRFYYAIFPIGYRNNDNPSNWMIDRINEIPSIMQTFYTQ